MANASRIERVSGHAVVLAIDDVDTDRIIPARFLKALTFDGLGAHVFEDDRRALSAKGETHPFDDPSRQGAPVLITGASFGCGSSREHAPQALMRWGIRAIVARSFGEIFSGNASMIGLACVTLEAHDLDALKRLSAADPALDVTVDLSQQRVVVGKIAWTCAMPDTARSALLTGTWDTTGLMLDHYEDVTRVTSALPYLRGF